MTVDRFVSLILLLLLASCGCSSQDHVFRDEGRFDDLLRSTVYVDVDQLLEVDGTHMRSVGRYGSGTIVDIDLEKGESLVLTSGHACTTWMATSAVGEGSQVVATKVHVISFQNLSATARVLYASDSPDVCILVVDGLLGPSIEIASELPPVGVETENVGYPLGVRYRDSMFLTTGHYSGAHHGPFGERLLVSTPAVQGLSGSGIFYRGRQIGMLNAVYEDFPNMTICLGLAEIKKAIAIGELLWRKK